MKKENEKFELYYNGLLRLPEDERAEFWAALRRELPNSFRFCGSKGYATTKLKKLIAPRSPPAVGMHLLSRGFSKPDTSPRSPVFSTMASSSTLPRPFRGTQTPWPGG